MSQSNLSKFGTVQNYVSSMTAVNLETPLVNGVHCRDWTGKLHRDENYGYGIWHFGERTERGAHRISYIAFVGPVPDGMLVLHACDRMRCCEPVHLRVGTSSDNIRDTWARSPTMRSKCSKSRKGVPKSAQGRENIKTGANRPDVIERRKQAASGSNNPMSAENRARRHAEQEKHAQKS
jgi:hypothetical protein